MVVSLPMMTGSGGCLNLLFASGEDADLYAESPMIRMNDCTNIKLSILVLSGQFSTKVRPSNILE